jgi:hypothetical protein
MNAATSLPTNVSPSPQPTTSGELLGVQTDQRERPPQPTADRPHRVGQLAAACGHLPSHEMRDDLGVGVARELHAVAFQLGAQVVEVLDDAVVDDRDPAARVGVRVRVAVVRRAMGRPSGVAHAGGPSDLAAGEFGVEVRDAAGLLRDLQTLRADDGDAGRVVPAIFEAAQAAHRHVQRGPRPDVPDDSAHADQPNGAPTPDRSDAEGLAAGLLGDADGEGAAVLPDGALGADDGDDVAVRVTVCVTVGAGCAGADDARGWAGDEARCWLPNSVVPETASLPVTKSLSGRCATASTPVTRANTTANTATEPTARRVTSVRRRGREYRTGPYSAGLSRYGCGG